MLEDTALGLAEAVQYLTPTSCLKPDLCMQLPLRHLHLEGAQASACPKMEHLFFLPKPYSSFGEWIPASVHFPKPEIQGLLFPIPLLCASTSTFMLSCQCCLSVSLWLCGLRYSCKGHPLKYFLLAIEVMFPQSGPFSKKRQMNFPQGKQQHRRYILTKMEWLH